MYSKFLEGMAGKVADQWSTKLLTPAFLFWIGGLITLTSRYGWNSMSQWLLQQPRSFQVGLLISGLVVVVLSATIVESYNLATLRFLEGYWPRWMRPLRKWRVQGHINQWERALEKYSSLHGLYRHDEESLSEKQRYEYAQLDWQIVRFPSKPNQFMPTRLGNLLRASECRSVERYGLDAVVCWPRLWLLIPDNSRKELQEARNNLDNAVCNYLWSNLFLIWTLFVWWVPLIAIFSAWQCYRIAFNAAGVYADLLDSTFDLYRHQLYQALRYPLPTNPSQEINDGKRLTEYLWRGPDQDQTMPDFYEPPNPSS